jgi:hypothetical protein
MEHETRGQVGAAMNGFVSALVVALGVLGFNLPVAHAITCTTSAYGINDTAATSRRSHSLQ